VVRATAWILAAAALSAGTALASAPGVAATALASAAPTAGAALATGAPGVGATVSVTPAAGGPASVFVARFAAGDRTGTAGGQRRWDALNVTRHGPADHAGCVAAAQLTLPPSQRGAAVRVRLDPRVIGAGAASRSWCEGTYTGWIRQFAAPACKLGQACPDYILLLGTVGRFSFKVHAPPSPAAGGQSY
jgi:hypothetical protein